MKIKKLTIFLLASVLVLPALFSVQLALADGTPRVFLVSAYYSPLPDQTHYLRGTYEADIRLNGRGTNGADGTAVYAGMIAAPKNYDFGTKIEIPGLGIGTVHDRGGAIIAHQDYDRIDIWMGHGDEGLARALAWGMRTVEGIIYDDSSIEDTLDFMSINPADFAYIPKAKSYTSLLRGAEGEEVAELQSSLKELGYYNEAITGYFGELTEKAVFDFQVAEGLVGSMESPGAGCYGPKTHSALSKKIAKITQVATEQAKVIKNLFPVGMGEGLESDNVLRLQLVLKDLGYLSDEADGSFDSDTEKAVLDFQLSNNVVTSNQDAGAGYFGPKTHQALVDTLGERKTKVSKFSPEIKTASYTGSGELAKKSTISQPAEVYQQETTTANTVKIAVFN